MKQKMCVHRDPDRDRGRCSERSLAFLDRGRAQRRMMRVLLPKRPGARPSHKPSVPAAGCFEASYPSLEWNQVECVEAPNIQFRPRTGSGSQTVGDGDDYAAEVTSGLISQTVGSFPKVKGVTSEDGRWRREQLLAAAQFQLHEHAGLRRRRRSSGLPGLAAVRLFVGLYSGIHAILADLLEHYVPRWMVQLRRRDCYTNSAAVTMPKENITELKTIKLSGLAKAGGLDTLVMTVGKKAYSITGEDSVVYLSTAWTESEFNIVGDGGGSEADFNTGSSITVKVAVTNGTTNAAKCASDAGTTGETNNLNLGTCSGKGGATPYIKFTESN